MQMLWKIRIPFCIINVTYRILHWVLLIIYKKPPSIPPITSSIYTLSATELAKKIRQREITSLEVVEAYITRIEKVNPIINAAVDQRFAAARNEAKECDKQIKFAGKFDIDSLEKDKPLYGVPMSIKECYAVKGCSYTGCTLSRKGKKARYDAAVVEMLRNAGAIPLCITNTPEMCNGFDTTNRLYGRTRNPYDTRYSPGGSSGGEGALIGAGGSVIGIGSDMGGSVRIPSFANGIFGHKPTPDIIPSEGHWPYSKDKHFQKVVTMGPMARYAEDLRLLMKIMTSKCNRNLRLDVPVNLRQIKVYYRQGLDRSCGVLPVSPEMKECVLKAANHFERYGARAEKLPIDWPVTITETVLTTYLNIKEGPDSITDIFDPEKNVYLELMKAVLCLPSKCTRHVKFLTLLCMTHTLFTEADVARYTKHGEEIRQKLLDLLGDDGVYICPTWRGSFLPQLASCEMMSLSNTAIFNAFGFPAVHVPMGLNREGLPVGVQVVAAPYQDRLCLAVAKELEVAFGGWVPPSISITD